MAADLVTVFSLLPSSVPFHPDSFDFAAIPAAHGVFLIETAGEPYVGKSASLRRRLERLLGPAETAHSRRLNLRATAQAVHYQSAGSSFATLVLLHRALRAAFPERYRDMLRLRVPPLLKINLANDYPRGYVTRKLGRGPGLYYGPFPSRAAAEKTASGFLDLFLVRRCVEAIHPDPAHPGCIYGEMNMCLRPCQNVSTAEQYREEVERLASFLTSGGATLVKEVEAERDDASEQLDFEAAARLHKRVEKVHQALKEAPGLAADLERLHGLVIQPSRPGQGPAVDLFPVWKGFLLPHLTFTFEVVEGKPVSMDARLRELLAGISLAGGSPRTRGEHLALLSRWYYRGRRAGEFVAFEDYGKLPFRRIVGAISRVARAASAPPDPPA